MVEIIIAAVMAEILGRLVFYRFRLGWKTLLPVVLMGLLVLIVVAILAEGGLFGNPKTTPGIFSSLFMIWIIAGMYVRRKRFKQPQDALGRGTYDRATTSESLGQSLGSGFEWGNRKQIEKHTAQKPGLQEKPIQSATRSKTQTEKREEIERSQTSTSFINLTDDQLYALAWKEVEGKHREEGLWARLFVENDGDETKARVFYLKLRVEELRQLRKKETEELQTRNQAKREAEKEQEKARQLELEAAQRQLEKEEDEVSEKLKKGIGL